MHYMVYTYISDSLHVLVLYCYKRPLSSDSVSDCLWVSASTIYLSPVCPQNLY